ncbi:MAG: hypothetical protein E7Z89_03145 [Cyanobacteria bacterium SIG28]|nr:hypothetical protein [Cyanobacteria bacterium SIG28]
MTLANITALNNMATMLYGVGGSDYLNSMYMNNPYTMGYINPYSQANPYLNPYSNSIFNNQLQNQIYPYNQTQATQTGVAQTASLSDIEKVKTDYQKTKTEEITQTWGSLPMAVGMIGLMENPQGMIHWWNSGKAMKATSQVFDLSNPTIKALWEKNPGLMQRAYTELNNLNAKTHSKLGAFVRRANTSDVQQVNDMMKTALQSGDEKAILRATETVHATKGTDGWLARGWNKIKSFFTGKEAKTTTIPERIANKSQMIDDAVKVPGALNPGFKSMMKTGLKGGGLCAAISLLMDSGKIIDAFKLGGTDSGVKQVGQTLVRAGADMVGFAVGRAGGAVLGAKVGAAIGTCFGPGVGTLIGGAIGLICGAAGSVVTSKLVSKFIPVDEGTKVKSEYLAKTPEGQVELLQSVMLKAQNPKEAEKIDPQVLQACQNIINSNPQLLQMLQTSVA